MNSALLTKGLEIVAQESAPLDLILPATTLPATLTAALKIEITKPAYTLAEDVRWIPLPHRTALQSATPKVFSQRAYSGPASKSTKTPRPSYGTAILSK
jgi:hypothetical protein